MQPYGFRNVWLRAVAARELPHDFFCNSIADSGALKPVLKYITKFKS